MKVGREGGRGRGESRKSSNVISGDHFSELTFKGGSAKFNLVYPQILRPPPPPPPLQAINNDQSLRGFYGHGKIRENLLVMCFIHMQKKMYLQQLKLGMCRGRGRYHFSMKSLQKGRFAVEV